MGGVIHIVMNNQIGFTTDPRKSRSTFYCTDILKSQQAPIFHINADFPEEAAIIAKIAFDYKKEFQKDVVIDLIGYRKFGHNEQDEPRMTQPEMYERIGQHPGVRTKYEEKLIGEGVLTAAEAKAIVKQIKTEISEAAKSDGSADY